MIHFRRNKNILFVIVFVLFYLPLSFYSFPRSRHKAVKTIIVAALLAAILSSFLYICWPFYYILKVFCLLCYDFNKRVILGVLEMFLTRRFQRQDVAGN